MFTLLLFAPVLISASLAFYTQAEAAGPSVRFITPQDGGILRGEEELIVEGVGFEGLEIVGSAYFEYSRDGKHWLLIGQDPYSRDGRFRASWNTAGLADGNYRLRATVLGIGEQRASAEIGVIIDNAMKLPFFRVPKDLSLEEALDRAPAGATIQLDARYGPFTGSFTITQEGLTLEGVHGLAELDGQGADVVLTVAAGGVTIESLRITGGRTGLLITGDNAAISGNEFLGLTLSADLEEIPKVGIRLREGSHARIEFNAFRGLIERAVVLESTSENTLVGNTFEGGCFTGIETFFSSGNLLAENAIRCMEGLRLSEFSSQNEIRANRIIADFIGIYLGGEENLIEDNLIQAGFAGVYAFGHSQLIAENRIEGLDMGEYGFLLYGDDILIRGNHIRGWRVGIDLSFGRANRIIENEITANIVGIRGNELTLLPGVDGLITIERNNIFGNLEFGLIITRELVGLPPGLRLRSLDARNNWWGHPTGPFHPERNPEGLGDRVSDFVLFEPWLREPVELP
jgi:parallel beta-helix repeat protein